MSFLKRKERKRRSRAGGREPGMSSEGREPALEQESRQHLSILSVWLQCRPSFVYEIYSKRRIAAAWLCTELKEELSFTLGAASCSPGTGRRGALKKRSACPPLQGWRALAGSKASRAPAAIWVTWKAGFLSSHCK